MSDAAVKRSGGATNRMAVIMMIQSSAPPKPACFSTDKEWREWLIQAHVSGLRVVRKVDIGKSAGNRQTSHRLLPTQQIPFCDGCRTDHMRRMEEQGRCQPCAVAVEV